MEAGIGGRTTHSWPRMLGRRVHHSHCSRLTRGPVSRTRVAAGNRDREAIVRDRSSDAQTSLN